MGPWRQGKKSFTWTVCIYQAEFCTQSHLCVTVPFLMVIPEICQNCCILLISFAHLLTFSFSSCHLQADKMLWNWLHSLWYNHSHSVKSPPTLKRDVHLAAYIELDCAVQVGIDFQTGSQNTSFSRVMLPVQLNSGTAPLTSTPSCIAHCSRSL